MIVEFIGSTGAGKTTLLTEVQRRLPREMQAISQTELAQDVLGLNRITNPTVANLVQDMVGLPFFLASLPRHRAFLHLYLRTMAPQQGYRFSSINYLRSIVRRIGMYELARRRQLQGQESQGQELQGQERHQHEQIVLVDEGTILSAHLLFVYGQQAVALGAIEQFARLVPLPDLIVYVRAPVDTLARRALARSDVRREVRAKSPAVVTEYLNRAVDVFDRLAEEERISKRLLVVENDDAAEFQPSDIANDIAERLASCILNCKSDGFPKPKSEQLMYATHLPGADCQRLGS